MVYKILNDRVLGMALAPDHLCLKEFFATETAVSLAVVAY
jgi:hypothetical protein